MNRNGNGSIRVDINGGVITVGSCYITAASACTVTSTISNTEHSMSAKDMTTPEDIVLSSLKKPTIMPT